MGDVTLHLGPVSYLFRHGLVHGAWCLGVFDNGHQGTLLGGITLRNVLVTVRCVGDCVGGWGSRWCIPINMHDHDCTLLCNDTHVVTFYTYSMIECNGVWGLHMHHVNDWGSCSVKSVIITRYCVVC